MTVLESTLSVENRYRQLFRQRLVILAVIFIAIIASLLLDFTLGPSGLPLHLRAPFTFADKDFDASVRGD